MARSEKVAGPGHNAHRDLTDDELAALVTSFTTKVITAQRKVDTIMVDLKSARNVVNGLFKLIKKETGYDRKEFAAEVIANLDKSDEAIAAAEARRRRLQVLAGVRPGEQLDLLEHTPDVIDDQISAEAAGYRAGRRAEDPIAPDTIATYLHPDWQRGWMRGQEVNAKAEAMAADILARPKPGEMVADDEPEGEEDPDAEIEAEVQRLEKVGWAAPTKDEAEFEESDNGRTIRKIGEAA